VNVVDNWSWHFGKIGNASTYRTLTVTAFMLCSWIGGHRFGRHLFTKTNFAGNTLQSLAEILSDNSGRGAKFTNRRDPVTRFRGLLYRRMRTGMGTA
jgi:hypothetical protein